MYCNNKNCMKTHCANHHSNHKGADAEDMNPLESFKCPHYCPKYKVQPQRPSLALAQRNGETVIEEYTVDQANGKKHVLNVYERVKAKKRTNISRYF